MEHSTRQAMLAQVWNAEGIESLLSLFATAALVRDHDLVHELHEQSVECERTAPQVAQQLHRVAGQLAELHAGLRAAQSIRDLAQWMRWQAEVPWRQSEAMERLLAAVAAEPAADAWPWDLRRLPTLQVELDRLLATARELAGLTLAERRPRVEADRRLALPELVDWLTARAARGDEQAPAFARLREQVAAWQRVSAPGQEAEQVASRKLDVEALAELVELWYRLDPALDRVCRGLVAEVREQQRSLGDAIDEVASFGDGGRGVERRLYLLYHLLDEPSASVREAALLAMARLAMSSEARGMERVRRGTLVQRWATAVELHWTVLSDPANVLEAVLRAVESTLPAVIDGSAPRVARDLMLVRARLLRRLAGLRDARLEEAIQAHRMALDALAEQPDPRARGRLLGELANLRRAQRMPDAAAQDEEIRSHYDQALDQLRGSTVLRARVLADYAVYLARPRRPVAEDSEHALDMVQRAVALLEGLSDSVRSHPLIRLDEAGHRMTRGNLRLELGPEAWRSEAVDDYRAALQRLGGGDGLVAGLIHLNLACVSLTSLSRESTEDAVRRAQQELEPAVRGLRPLPVPHARAVAERAMLMVRASGEDERVFEQARREVEAALQRLSVGAERVVRGRLERQLGELYMSRDGDGDLARAADRFAAARSAFVEGGAARLAVEAARDYAETMLHQHADEGDPAALMRGAVVLEQAVLLAEQRWSGRRPDEPTHELLAMLDGVYGDLAWFQAKLGRPAGVVLATVTRAKLHRPAPSFRALRFRPERSSMLSPAHLDPFARRLAPAPSGERRPSRAATVSELPARVEAFLAANPDALGLDLTLTRWGTVVVAVGEGGPSYGTVPLSRETVRRWVWGTARTPGWYASQRAAQEARVAGDDEQRREHERVVAMAGEQLARDLGQRLLEPAMMAVGQAMIERVVLLAPGRLIGLPFAAARIGGEPLVGHVRGFALLGSLAGLPCGSLREVRPRRALCMVADPSASDGDAPVEELRDVVRLLASARAEVEVLVRRGTAGGEAVYRPSQAKTRERVVVSNAPPTPAALFERIGRLDHLFLGGHGQGPGIGLVDAQGAPVQLDASALRQGPAFPTGSSVFISATRQRPLADDAEHWELLRALGAAGVGFVVSACRAVPPELARDFARSFYLYWALGRSIPEAYCAALANVTGSEPTHFAAFGVWLGALDESN